jgi:hypothetical protein
MANHYFDRRERAIRDVAPVMALMSFRAFTEPAMADKRPPAVEASSLHAADLELARDIDLYTIYLETVWVNHPYYLKEFRKKVDQMRFRDIEKFDFVPFCRDLRHSFRFWQDHWRPSQPSPRTGKIVPYPERGEKDLYLVTIKGYLYHLCGEISDDFTKTIRDIRAFVKVREIWVANNRLELNGEAAREYTYLIHGLNENALDYPRVPRVLAKILQKMEEFKQLEEKKARLIAQDKVRIAKLWEDDGGEWDEIEELEAELEILEELESEDSSNATIILTPNDSNTDEYMSALEFQLAEAKRNPESLEEKTKELNLSIKTLKANIRAQKEKAIIL